MFELSSRRSLEYRFQLASWTVAVAVTLQFTLHVTFSVV